MTFVSARIKKFVGESTAVLQLFAIATFATLLSVPARAQFTLDVQKEIAKIYEFKKSFSPAEKKMTTGLVLLSRQARNIPLNGLEKYVSSTATSMTVEIGAELTPSLMSSDVMNDIVMASGVDVPAQAYADKHLRARVNPSQLLDLASNPDVKFLSEADVATTNAGSVTSQGYITHTANKVISMGIQGSGVTVGVMSDSATPARVAKLIASGDLPSNTIVVPGQAGSATGSDEGTAMMEIVHDMAPGANLVFASAFNGVASFAANIRTLRFTYHCDIIVDDVTYFNEAVFQDGPIAQAVNDVTADGALYLSSAGNSGNLTKSTSGTWEGDFVSGGAVSGVIGAGGETGLIHSFGAQTYDTLTSASTFVSLKWSDALANSANDYDLFILNSTGTTLKAFSAGSQTGTQDPYEAIGRGTNCGTVSASGYCPAVGDRIVVVLFSGTTRALHVDTNRARLAINTAGATFGHNAGKNTVTLAATFWNSAKTGTKPFTGAANPVETFSSDGPRTIFYNPDGSTITPGNVLFGTNGGVVLQKPDLTAADGGNTATPGFAPFFGTSAAAPHAAGIAALVKSANPALTNVQIRNILANTSLDNMAPGADRDGGYGIVMALPAVQAALALVP